MKLQGADSHDVTTPNNDTLYATSFLDLSQGPVMLTIPALPRRYHSAALMALNTDNVAVIGTRSGGQGGRYAIVGPGFKGRARPIPSLSPCRPTMRGCWSGCWWAGQPT